MLFGEMPQGQDKVIQHNDENAEFNHLVSERCNNNACTIINEDKFIHELLLDLKSHDERTFLHSLEVGNMTAFLIDNLKEKFTEKEKRILMSSALLHDYGKTSINPDILNKKEILTPEEKLEIEKHPMEGFYALKEWNIDVAKVAVSHHEHQEHTYPRKGNLPDILEKRTGSRETNRLSRILAIVDSFQAMIDPTRPTSIRNPKTIDQTIAELNKKFILSEDKEIIFLLENYYYEKEANKKRRSH